jgi:Ca-activated chloride channel family protein
VPDIIVLLTDGANTRGVEPLDAAPLAAQRRVRVYTIGFGTTQPASLACSRSQLGGDAFGDSFGGPGSFGTFDGRDTAGPPVDAAPRSYLVIDEPTLQAVAEQTGGRYYRAESADQLVRVFEELPRDVERQTTEREITVAFTVGGALLLLGALLASHRFSPRL